MSVSATIYIDHRENAMERSGSTKLSPVSYFDKAIDASNRKHANKPLSGGGGTINYVVREVPTGDYCIVLRAPGNNNGILAAAIERKEWKDLAASIKDGRASGQSSALKAAKQEYGCKVYFLAEGGFTYKDDTRVGGKHGMPFAALHTKLRHELLRGVPFIQCKDAEHTVDVIVKIARDLVQLYARKEIEFPLQTNGNRLVNAYVQSICRLNAKFRTLSEDTDPVIQVIADIEARLNEIPVDAEPEDPDAITSLLNDGSTALPKDFAKRRVAGSADIISDIWTAIPGITGNSAPIISETYHVSQFFRAMGDVEELDRLQAEIAEMRFPSGSRIGKQADKIITNFRTPERARNTAIRVLSAIPQVTENTAKNILDLYDIQRICNPDTFNAENLAGIPRSAKTNVGPALAKKILQFLHPVVS